MPRKTRVEVLLNSEKGDYIGQGRSYSYSLTNTSFKVRLNNKNAVSFSLERGNENWRLDFAAPSGMRLRVGRYENAVRAAFRKTAEPGLTIAGNGRGSNESFGEFTIRNLRFTRSGGDLVMFTADFLQYSENSDAPALRGTIYYYQKP